MKKHSALLLTVTLFSVLFACSHTEDTKAKTPTTAASTSTSASAATSSLTDSSATSGAETSPSSVSISEEIRTACGIADADAHFAFDSAHLARNETKGLDALVRCFVDGKLKGRRASLVGHTDSRGTDEYNMTLGQSRADSVMLYLMQKGLGKDQVQSTSRGAMDATGKDESGWAHDRRVDILLAK